MAFFRQLRLLLRHKLLLRRRKLSILGLEFFWPAVVFFSVLLLRLQFPPETKNTCFYNSKALPSVGGVNFFQSLVCTVDNSCLNQSTYRDVPHFPKARIHKLVEYLSPLLTDARVTEVIHDLPAGIKLVSTIVDTISQPEVKSLLENGLSVGKVFHDPSGSDSPDTSIFIPDEIMEKAGLTRGDLPGSLRSLKVAAAAMPSVKDFIHNFTSTLDLQEEIRKLDFRRNGIDLLGTPEAADIIGKTMCGHPLSMLRNEFKHFRPNPRGFKLNEQEMKSLPSDFCRDGYRNIMKLSGGPVLWSWLKPILAGKILYTPDNHLTKAIMERMNNSFNFMSVLIRNLEAWSQTFSSLKTFYADPHATERLQGVQHIVIQLLGKDVLGLFEDLESSRLVERFVNSGGILGLVQLAGNIAQCFELKRFISFSDEVSMEVAARQFTKSHELIAGIVFLNINETSQSLPKNVEYKIRADIDFVPTTKALKDRIWEPGPRDDYANHLGYFRGFVQVQELIDRAITMYHTNTSQLTYSPSVHLQQFPYGCYKEDKFGFFIVALTPVTSTVAWIFLIAFLIRDFVLERELNLEEYLRVTGLKATVAWSAWFIIGFSALIFGSVCFITIFKFANLLPHSDLLILYIYLIAFSFSIIMFCYLVSCFFRTATIASLSGIVAYLASYLPFMVAITLEHEMPYLHKIFTCLSMSTSFCFGIMYLARYETQGVGVQWSNIWHSPMAEDSMNFASAVIMLFIDGCIYFLIAWYISNVRPPGKNGHREPWYFFILPSYWSFSPRSSSSSHHVHRVSNIQSHLHYNSSQNGKSSLDNRWSQVPPPPRSGMSIHNLYVIYNKGRSRHEHRAVSNLTLELREGQITTLLGRNGAGKTTTISVLTGQLKPTSGSVLVYGHPVPEEFNEARKLLGYCPQYNVLFGDLTVREHLKFFASLKGLLSDDQIDDDVDITLQSTGLGQLQHEFARNLSGGLQRRLCVALAFVGGSKLIILDEPTSSVDPVARRSIWNLIVRQKQSRTVLLTTHHMDEADILSDQVAVIHRGKLLCNGSPLLLRSKYGCGYQLTVSRQSLINDEKEANDSDSGRASNEPPPMPDNLDQSESERLLAFVKCLIPNASFIADYNSSEVVLALPTCAHDGTPHDYATFFRCLDANIHNLGFGSYGLTSTTLEEVFLTLCNSQENAQSLLSEPVNKIPPIAGQHNHNHHHKLSSVGSPVVDSVVNSHLHPMSLPSNNGTTASINKGFTDPHELRYQLDQTLNGTSFTDYQFPKNPPLANGIGLKCMQLWALLYKRALHTSRDWRSLLCNLLLPCMFIALAMGMTCIKPRFAPDPILPISPTIYGPSTTSFFHLPRSYLISSHSSLPPSTKVKAGRTTASASPRSFQSLPSSSSILPSSSPSSSASLPSSSSSNSRLTSSSSFSSSSLEMPDNLPINILNELVLQRRAPDLNCPKPREGWKVAKCPVVRAEPSLPGQLSGTISGYDELCKCSSASQDDFSLSSTLFSSSSPSFSSSSSPSSSSSSTFNPSFSESCTSDDHSSGHSMIKYNTIDPPIITEHGFLFNLSALERIEPFLLNTFPLFNDYRFGGFSFHQLKSPVKRRKNVNSSGNNNNNNSSSTSRDMTNLNKNKAKHLIKVWYDNNGYHAMTSYLNALDNAIMRANLRSAGLRADEYSITTYSHPFHMRSAQLGDQSLMQRAADAGIALIILVGFVFIPTSFVFYIVRERTHEEKQLQRIFGVGTFLYWTSAIIWDTLSIIIASTICGLIIYAFQLPIYTARLNLPAVVVLLLLFGWAMSSWVYLLEKFFDEPSIAFMVIYCISLFIGISTMVMRLMIDVFHILEVSPIFKETFQSFALLFPPYALMSGLVDVTKNQLFAEIFTLFGQDTYANPFSMEMLGQHFIYLATEGFFLFLLNFLIELIKNSSFFNKSGGTTSSRSVDNGVSVSSSSSSFNEDNCGYNAFRGSQTKCKINKAKAIRATPADGPGMFDILRVVGVTKIFKSMFGHRTAVDNISFGVPRGECFGLLGVNGAGKTTLFKILTGQLRPSSGKAYIGGKSITKSLALGDNNSRNLGYCPQADALDMVLTPRQHLTIYARLRGIPSLCRAHVVSESLSKFQLTTHSEMPISALSRGTRRKLCLAIAMLGNPSLVLLDEPTSGMDPLSRRCLWQNIQNAVKEQRSVLLTSHSMEECDILCSRLAIMVNGRFRCIGSPQYLKYKFGSGYTITLRLSESVANYEEAIRFMKQCFPFIRLRAHHYNMLEFSLPTNDVLLSEIFHHLQKGTESLRLQDFSVTQTTLDQVFVSFADQQSNDY
ncbi:phospholipid-transporting ATPase ABCA1-like [Brevipalpus obovatus]|uniref:phospholipid-transporting ATPase ABCA1-like n=1 Tax=Brevipalpus obovatus TaxID=246614 RepID=UPI003D9DE21D